MPVPIVRLSPGRAPPACHTQPSREIGATLRARRQGDADHRACGVRLPEVLAMTLLKAGKSPRSDRNAVTLITSERSQPAARRHVRTLSNAPALPFDVVGRELARLVEGDLARRRDEVAR